MKNKKPAGEKFKGKKLSAALGVFFDGLTKPSITLGELRDNFSGHSYGILIFLLALPNLIPLPAPGLSAIVGAPLVLVTGQLAFGRKTPWLPKSLARKKIKRDSLQRTYKRIERYLKWLEVIMKPRLHFLVAPPAQRFIGLICMMLAALVMLPVPFGNAFPALAICFLAMAMLMLDGLFIIIGLTIALSSVALIIAVVNGSISGVEALLEAF